MFDEGGGENPLFGSMTSGQKHQHVPPSLTSSPKVLPMFCLMIQDFVAKVYTAPTENICSEKT